MKNWLCAVAGAWVCLSISVFADELPATVRFTNVVPSDLSPSVEVEGYQKVELVTGRAVGPVGLRPGEYQMTFMLAGKKHQRVAQLVAGRGKLFIVAPKDGDASEMQVKEYEALHRDLVGAGEGRTVRMINLTARDLVIQTTEGEDEIKPGKQQMLATKESQLPLTVGDEVVATVDFRDLNACSVVFYIDAESKLAAVILPEPMATSEDDER